MDYKCLISAWLIAYEYIIAWYNRKMDRGELRLS